jgi:preprotein translocase subunit SecE
VSSQGVARFQPRRWRRFLREVALELRKVDWPTRSELVTYSVVVLVTIMALTLFIGLVDLTFAKTLLGIFGL